MKRLRTLFASTAFATCLAITGPVSADLPVIGVSNLKQSILTAANTLREVNNQITQIQQIRPDAAERSPQPSLASVHVTAADHQCHRPGEQPDEAGAEPCLRRRPDRSAVSAAIPVL